MLLLLPVLVFGAAFLLFWGKEAEESGDLSGWGAAFLRAAVVWGALVVVFSEGLGLFRAVRAGPLATAWAAALVVLLVSLVRGGGLRTLWARRRGLVPPRLHPVEGVILVGLAAELAVLFAIAWTSPPNNTDSLQYHMARVVHWAQQGSLDHYPTAFEPQLWHPLWSELAILNARVLWGSDQPANLVQVTAFIGSLVAVGSVARLLGAGRRGRIAAIAFAASLPIAILEATGTQNDLVVAFWLATLCFFAALEHRSGLSRLDLGLAGIGVGIGLLTKGTFYPYGLIPTAWLLVGRLKRQGWKNAALGAVLIAVLAGILNVGLWARNYRTYGSIVGQLSEMAGPNLSHPSPAGIVASWAENLALNLGTPSEAATGWIVETVRRLSAEGGRPPFALVWAWNNENLAGNPVHLGIVGLSLLGFLVLWARKRSEGLRPAATYAVAVWASLLLLLSLLAFDLYGVRYQLPFFVAMAPVVGVVGERALRPQVVLVASLVLLLLGAPWVLLNGSRPAIGMKPRTMIDSVFDEPAPVILMANWTDLRDVYFGGAEAVRESGCDRVGLRLDSHDLEYAYWWLLDAPQSGIRIENIDPPPHLERYVDPQFRPCAILCMVCGGRTRFHGLDRAYSEGAVSVFLGSNYTPAED